MSAAAEPRHLPVEERAWMSPGAGGRNSWLNGDARPSWLAKPATTSHCAARSLPSSTGSSFTRRNRSRPAAPLAPLLANDLRHRPARPSGRGRRWPADHSLSQPLERGRRAQAEQPCDWDVAVCDHHILALAGSVQPPVARADVAGDAGRQPDERGRPRSDPLPGLPPVQVRHIQRQLPDGEEHIDLRRP